MNDLQRHRLKKIVGTTKAGKQNWKLRMKWFFKIMKVRMIVLTISSSVLLFLMKFGNIDPNTISLSNTLSIVTGLLSIIAILFMLVPYPHWWELKAGEERSKYYGNEFHDGL